MICHLSVMGTLFGLQLPLYVLVTDLVHQQANFPGIANNCVVMELCNLYTISGGTTTAGSCMAHTSILPQ